MINSKRNNYEASAEHKDFLKSLTRKKRLVWFCRIAILFAFILVWEAFAYFKLIDPFIFSSPSRVCKQIYLLAMDGSLGSHIGATLTETVIGFVLAVALGYLIALALWWNESVRKIFEPYLVVLNALPKIALGPLIIIWFGTGEKSIIFMTLIIGVIIVIMNMLSGFCGTEKGKILLLRSMGASKPQLLTRLIIPASLPAFFSTLKISVGMAWIGSIMGEYLVSRRGLGYLIVYGGQVFKLDLVMAATVILCVLAGIMYFIVACAEKFFIKRR